MNSNPIRQRRLESEVGNRGTKKLVAYSEHKSLHALTERKRCIGKALLKIYQVRPKSTRACTTAKNTRAQAENTHLSQPTGTHTGTQTKPRLQQIQESSRKNLPTQPNFQTRGPVAKLPKKLMASTPTPTTRSTPRKITSPGQTKQPTTPRQTRSH